MGGKTPKRPHSPTSGTNPLKLAKDEISLGDERSEDFSEDDLRGSERNGFTGKISSKSSGKMKKRAKVGHVGRRNSEEDGDVRDEDISTIWKHIQQQEASSKALGVASSSSSASRGPKAFQHQLIKQQQEELDASLARRLAAGEDPFGEDEEIAVSDDYETADEDIDEDTIPGSKLWEKYPNRAFSKKEENSHAEHETFLRRKKEVELDEAFARQLQQEEYGARYSGEPFRPQNGGSRNESILDAYRNDSNSSSPRISYDNPSDEIAPLRAWWAGIIGSERCCSNCGSQSAFEKICTTNIRTQLDAQFGIKLEVEKADKLEAAVKKVAEEKERERSRMILYGRIGRGRKLGDSREETSKCTEPELENGTSSKEKKNVFARVRILGAGFCPKCNGVICLGCGKEVHVPEEIDEDREDGPVSLKADSHNNRMKWCCPEGRTIATALILQFLDEETLDLPTGPYKGEFINTAGDEDKKSLGAAVKRGIRGVREAFADTGSLSSSTKKPKQTKSPPRTRIHGRKPGGYNAKGTGYGGFDEHLIDWDSYEESELDFEEQYFEDDGDIMSEFSTMFQASIATHPKHMPAKLQADVSAIAGSSSAEPASAPAKSPIPFMDLPQPYAPASSSKAPPMYPMSPTTIKPISGRGGPSGSPGSGGGMPGSGRGRGMGSHSLSPNYFFIGPGKTVGGGDAPTAGMSVAGPNPSALIGPPAALPTGYIPYGSYVPGSGIIPLFSEPLSAGMPIPHVHHTPTAYTSPTPVSLSAPSSVKAPSTQSSVGNQLGTKSPGAEPHTPYNYNQGTPVFSPGFPMLYSALQNAQLPPGAFPAPPFTFPEIHMLQDNMPSWKRVPKYAKGLPTAPPLSARQTRQDLSLTAILSTLLDLLPRESIKSKCDTDIIKVLLRVSSFSESMNELLRNDSIQDLARRWELYTALLKFLQRVATERFMLEVFVGKRKHKRHSIGVLRIAQSPAILPAEADDRPGPRTRRKTAAVAEARKKLEEVLVYKDVETEGWAKSSWEVFEKLYKQCHMFLKVVEKSNEKDFQDEEGTKTVGLCADVVSVRESIEKAINVTGVLEKSEMSKISINAERNPSPVQKGKSKATEDSAFQVLSLPEKAKMSKDEVKDMDHTYHGPLAFDYVEGVLTTHYFHQKILTLNESPRGRVLHLTRELATMSTSLPHGVFVRVEENRPDVIKALIVGPSGTPYEGGLYEFDVWAPMEYPNGPPFCQFKTTGGGSVHFNPNLYACGKVCLSVINTWSGAPSERWQPGLSTLLQVFVSIQSMILCENPWYNEPGRREGTHSKTSDEFNLKVRISNVRWAMLDWLKDSAKKNGLWKDVVNAHFKTNKAYLLGVVNGWAKKDPSLRNYRGGGLGVYEIYQVDVPVGLARRRAVVDNLPSQDLVADLDKAFEAL
ncbi:hypothetical protein RUND412_001473 [Rhizina undulata]